jgi:hypothetical protein
MSEGIPVYERNWPILISEIDQGRDFSFFAFTSGKYMVRAEFVDGSAEIPDADHKVPLRLLLTNWQSLLFAPINTEPAR